jgi:hypothetical protein
MRSVESTTKKKVNPKNNPEYNPRYESLNGANTTNPPKVHTIKREVTIILWDGKLISDE